MKKRVLLTFLGAIFLINEVSGPLCAQDNTTESRGTVGILELLQDAIFGDFRHDRAVFREDAVPECVADVGYYAQPDVSVGHITIGGSFIGHPGGPPSPIVMNPISPMNNYNLFPGSPPFIFPMGTTVEVSVQSTGYGTNPAIPLTRLYSADEERVKVLTPVVVGGTLTVQSTQPLIVTWIPPSSENQTENAKMIVALYAIAGTSQLGEVRCGFNLAAGRGVVPESLLRAVKNRVNPNPAPSFMRMFIGDRQEIRAGDATYILELGSYLSTNIFDVFATVQ